MDRNPYAPSQQTQTSWHRDSTVDDSPVFRDGPLLIVPRVNADFPPICVGSGEKSDEVYVLKTRLPPKLTWLVSAFTVGPLGLFLITMIWGERIALELPANSQWLRDSARAGFKSQVSLGIGCLSMIGGVAMMLLASWFVLVGLFVFVVSLCFAYGYGRSANRLRVCRVDKMSIWVSGVSPVTLDEIA